jgi:hypothetical protein
MAVRIPSDIRGIEPMADIVLVIVTVAFFAVTFLVLKAVEKL